MPSPFTSSMDNRELSTRAHWAIQLGKASKLLPTKCCMTSNLTRTASAGALRYSSAIKNSDHATDSRAASPEQRVILTKFALLSVALVAAFVAALKPSDILPLVSASFSMAASAFVPVMVLGIFWRGTTRKGAVAGMLCGLGVAVYYILSHLPVLQALPAWLRADGLWFGIQPVSAGVFGVPAGLLTALVVSWWTRPVPPPPAIRLEM